KRCNSRPRPPTCSRLSAAPPSTSRPCSTHWSSRRHDCVRRIRPRSCARRMPTRINHAASCGHTAEYDELVKTQTFAPGRDGVVARVLLERKSVQIPDVLADPEYNLHEFARLGGYRTILGVPLLRQGVPIGLLVLHRATVRPFTAKQIELVETFADQAVIAIENVRLVDEVQARTAELSESLEQQTASSEVLQVISSSPGELEPVFQAMLANATRICDAKFGMLYLWEVDAFRAVAF